ncbi:MAG: hypothetical protein EAZ32_01465 [Cytophagia bacterium]|nr:MAG: hypothetical protein EAZ46_00830 [Runella sp.]TAG22923.1 MAG: hypothetical protein EAZ38_03940 [Cytophagales bacterium]TAG41978.1 MAG: hypothetical protein EAZ32_01465 [Cytophagia bacterium]TAG51502.1 MAG: hypothetical protein EAZ29_09420 [Runella slithyformis]TAG82448.1 MAG: hypothetical protein EAZ22_05235 [Cytophagales bacterium]
MKKTAQTKPAVSKIAFWDVNFDNIDFEKNSIFVMDKVFNYGTWNDIVAILKYYGLARIKKEVVEIAYFKDTALSFLCLVLHLKEQDFRAYQQRKARGSVWQY